MSRSCMRAVGRRRGAPGLIVPSLVPETFGRTSVEAQAMGCPVILSEIGALPETIVSPMQDRERFTGWLVPAGDAMALADAIHAALALSPEERAVIGVRASARASAEFVLSQMQMKTLAVYDELLGTHLAEAFRGSAFVGGGFPGRRRITGLWQA